jgi:AcrR family transcriptional regulator
VSGASAPEPRELEAPAKVSGWDLRREAIARRIEAVALKLFAKHGVERVTVEKIATETAISERTFFRYFQSREDILVALPSRQLARLSAVVEARPASEDIVTAFRAAVRTPSDSPDERELTFLWGRIMLQSPRAGAAAVGRLHPNMTETFERLIAARLPADRRAERAAPLAAAIGGIVGFAYTKWVSEGGQGDLADLIERAFDALLELSPHA